MLANLKNLFSRNASEKALQNGWLVLCVLFVLGIFYSRSILSILPSLFFAFAVFRADTWAKLKTIKQSPELVAMLAFFLLIPLSFYHTETRLLFKQMHRYAVFFLIPLAFWILPPLRPKQRYSLLAGFILLTTVFVLGTAIYYFQHFEEQNKLINQGVSPQTIDTIFGIYFGGIFHIHFGMMIAMGIFFALNLSRSNVVLWHKTEKYLLLACAIILFLGLHVLAYRTGALVFYITLLLTAFVFIFLKRKFLLGFGLIVILGLAPYVAFKTLPSVQNQVGVTFYDIDHYRNNQNINDFSISKRLAAWETAAEIAKNNWFAGVGPANVEEALQWQYGNKNFNLKPENRVMIHNQYLHVFVSSGIIGLLVFLFLIFSPVRQLWKRQDFNGAVFLCVFATGMLVDTLFELQHSRYMFVFFYAFFFVMRTFSSTENSEKQIQA
jgi:O-antigen ligase